MALPIQSPSLPGSPSPSLPLLSLLPPQSPRALRLSQCHLYLNFPSPVSSDLSQSLGPSCLLSLSKVVTKSCPLTGD